MNSLATIICLFISVVCCAGRKSASYPCNVYGNGMVGGLSGLETDTVATGCPNGVINWSYPKGRFVLIFPLESSVRSRVCLQTRSRLGNIKDVIAHQVLTLTDGRYCTPYTVGAYTILEFTPPQSGFQYRAIIRYTIEQRRFLV